MSLPQIDAILKGQEVQTLVPLTTQVVKMLSGKDLTAKAMAVLQMLQSITTNLQVILAAQ